jgi:hypothetical protein
MDDAEIHSKATTAAVVIASRAVDVLSLASSDSRVIADYGVPPFVMPANCAAAVP